METDMGVEKKYGSDDYWGFLPAGWDGKEVAIWKNNVNGGEVVARAKDKYEARTIIDALIKHGAAEPEGLSNKELAFLEFVCAHCVEPYATMASNAILWKDHTTYIDLRDKFPQIYQ
jgi:hypothetical protein